LTTRQGWFLPVWGRCQRFLDEAFSSLCSDSLPNQPKAVWQQAACPFSAFISRAINMPDLKDGEGVRGNS